MVGGLSGWGLFTCFTVYENEDCSSTMLIIGLICEIIGLIISSVILNQYFVFINICKTTNKNSSDKEKLIK